MSDETTFSDNLFHALVVSRIWVLYKFNRGSIADSASIPDLKWGNGDLKKEIEQSNVYNIFTQYNVVVYSPSGELINDTETPHAYLIQYKSGYAALLLVSLSERGRKHETLSLQSPSSTRSARPPKAAEDDCKYDNFPREMGRGFSPSFSPLMLQPAPDFARLRKN